MRLLAVLPLLACLVDARQLRKDQLKAMQKAAADRFQPPVVTAAQSAPKTTIQFNNPRAKDFYVDGKNIPQVEFDAGPSWAGLLPISNKKNETRQLFFWYFPPEEHASTKDLIFWTNGGPGCSSMEGFLQENGPISWSWGTAKPVRNDFSWTKLAGVLWVEQPVGTGYSQGKPNIRNEDDLAEQLVGFMQQFLEVFKELKGQNFYLTGESYAGKYIPYIANYIYDHPKALDLNMKGIWIADPSLAEDVIQEQIPAVPYVHKFEQVFALNQSTIAYIDSQFKKCGYDGYLEKYTTYPPPKGPFPVPPVPQGCDLWGYIFEAALVTNPAFNVYRIFDTYPVLWDVLGFPGSFPNEQTLPLYFDRTDVKKALHVPTSVKWEECSSDDVFPNGDGSPPSSYVVLPKVIDKNERTVVLHGLADYVLIAEGTRVVLQNMTWGGQQGFQSAPKPDSFVVDGIGAYGTAHTERKLSYVEMVITGHMIPQFSPAAALQTMQYLLGFRDTI